MPITIAFDPIYDSGNKPTQDIVDNVVTLMTNTAVTENEPKRGLLGQYKTLYDKTIGGYIKFSCGKTQVGSAAPADKEVVIIYHLLQHFKPSNRWSISIGFDLAIFSGHAGHTTKDVDDDTEYYVQFVDAISKQLLVDTRTYLGSDAGLVIYDDVYAGAVPAPKPGFAPEIKRRAGVLGEVGWISHFSSVMKTEWFINGPFVAPRPTDKDGNYISGWGRDTDKTVVRTVLRPA